jgi:hypothetical protein
MHYTSRFFSFFSLWLYSPLNLGRFFSFLILYTFGRTHWTEDQPVARPLPTHRTTQTQNKRRQMSMTRVGFEPMSPVLERAKTVYALDLAAPVIGPSNSTSTKYICLGVLWHLWTKQRDLREDIKWNDILFPPFLPSSSFPDVIICFSSISNVVSVTEFACR